MVPLNMMSSSSSAVDRSVAREQKPLLSMYKICNIKEGHGVMDITLEITRQRRRMHSFYRTLFGDTTWWSKKVGIFSY